MIKMDSSSGPKAKLFVFFIMILFKSGIGSMNSSLAILTSTRLVRYRAVGMYLIYGDPDVYLAEMERNRTSNTSYEEFGIHKIYSETPLNGALDVDYNKHHTYWSVNHRQRRGRLTFWPLLIPDRNVTSSDLFNAPVTRKVTGLAVDWISNLLYWSDVNNKQIGVIETRNYEKWRTVVDKNLSSPQDVVVYPQQSFLFWSDAGSKPKIEMLDLAQDIRKVLVTSPIVQSPKTLVIDYASIRLFWLDTAKTEVSSVKFDGSDYSSWTSSLFSQISSFFLYKQYIVLGDQSKFTIYFYNMTTRQSIFNYTNEALQNISDIVMYEPTRQPDMISPCKINNGGCDQFCITVNATSRKCQCENGWFPADNGVKCIAKPLMDNFLLFANSRPQGIYQADLSTGEVRGVINGQNIAGTRLDFDPTSNDIYWSDRYGRIFRTNLNTLESTLLVNSTVLDLYRLTYDPTSGQVYFLTRNYDLKKMTFIQPGSANISDFLKRDVRSWRRAILLDVSKRLLYWSECGKRTIERTSIYNSSNRETVISSLTSCVNALAMDFQDEVIFWADESGSIGSSNLDGSDRRQLYVDNSTDITGIACDKSYVYFGGYSRRYLHRIDRRTGQKLAPFTKQVFSIPYFILRYNSTDYPRIFYPRCSNEDYPESSGSTSKGWADWTTAIIKIAIFTYISIFIIIIILSFIVAFILEHTLGRRPSTNVTGNRIKYKQF